MSASLRRQDIVSIMIDLGLVEEPEATDTPPSDVQFADLGMDSLTVLDFCMQLEEKTGLSVEPGDLASHPSLHALAAFLEEKGRGAGSR